MSFIVKIILLELAFALSAPAAATTQYIVHLSFNLSWKLIDRISSDLQKLPNYFNGKAIVVFLIPFSLSGSLFPNNLALNSKI